MSPRAGVRGRAATYSGVAFRSKFDGAAPLLHAVHRGAHSG